MKSPKSRLPAHSSTQLDWVCLSQHRLSIVLHQQGSPMQWFATERNCLLLMPQLVSCCGSPTISAAAPSLHHIPGGICPASTRMRGARGIQRHEPHQRSRCLRCCASLEAAVLPQPPERGPAACAGHPQERGSAAGRHLALRPGSKTGPCQGPAHAAGGACHLQEQLDSSSRPGTSSVSSLVIANPSSSCRALLPAGLMQSLFEGRHCHFDPPYQSPAKIAAAGRHLKSRVQVLCEDLCCSGCWFIEATQLLQDVDVWCNCAWHLTQAAIVLGNAPCLAARVEAASSNQGHLFHTGTREHT